MAELTEKEWGAVADELYREASEMREYAMKVNRSTPGDIYAMGFASGLLRARADEILHRFPELLREFSDESDDGEVS